MTNLKYDGWQDIKTIQSKEILNELIESKENASSKMIISDSGIGKTNTIRLFKKAMPKNTHVITVGDTYSLIILLQEVMISLELTPFNGRNSKHIALRDISKRVVEISKEGGKPIIILDEAENSKVNMLKAYKQLYDAINGLCGFVLIGTDQLIDAMNKRSSSISMPQLRRRFKAGTRLVSSISKARDFTPFFELYIPDEENLKDLLIELCDNYGELHDYLDPVLRYASKTNKPVTEQMFRLFHKLPANTQNQKFKRA
jgi:DNA transposition AAA+ family ATPase